MSEKDESFDPLADAPPPNAEKSSGETDAAQHTSYFEEDSEGEKKAAQSEKEPVDKETLDRLLQGVRNTVKGNGFPVDKINLEHFEGEVLNFGAVQILEIIPEVAEKQVNGKERGEKTGSRQDMHTKIRSHIESISRNREVRQQAVSLLRKMNDLGFYRDGIILNLDKFGKQYVVHEPCNICDTRGTIKCQTCHGKREIMCNQCQGTRETQCTQCQGRQFIDTARGRTQCHLCHGRGRIGCRTCQQTGQVKCHICRGQGTSACKQCGSTGWHSHVSLLRIKTKGHFEYNRNDVSEALEALIDKYQSEIVTKEHGFVRIEDEMSVLDEYNRKVKENEIAIPYEVKLPWGNAKFQFAKKTVEGNMFGFKGLFFSDEPYLEKVVRNGLQMLDEAANSISNVGDKIAAATKYRLVAEVYMIGGRMPPRKALAALKRKYPSGITEDTLKGMIARADKSLQQLTDKPRQTGMYAGLGVSAVVFAAYFFALRQAIIATLPAQQISIVMDILLLGGGIAGTIFAIRYWAAKTIRAAFKHLAKEKDKMPVKAGKKATTAVMGILIIYGAILGASIAAGIEPPFWIESMFPSQS